MNELAEVHGQPGLRAGGGRRKKKKKKNARPDAWTEFRGVSRRQSGKFGAQIREPTGGVHSHRWLGTFDTARAYDLTPAWGSKGDAAMSLGSLDLTPAEWQQADELLNDMDYSAADREALAEAAAILRHISLAGHGDGRRS